MASNSQYGQLVFHSACFIVMLLFLFTMGKATIIDSDELQQYNGKELKAFVNPPMAKSIGLNPLIVEGKAYWNRIEAQQNILDELKKWLKQCYR